MRKLPYLLICFVLTGILGGCSKDDGTDPQPAPVSTDPSLSLSFTEKYVPLEKGSVNVNVTSNVVWLVESLTPWITLDKSAGADNQTVKIDYELSDQVGSRKGQVKFTSEGLDPVIVTIIQAKTFTNPLAQSIQDPWILKHDGWYYFCKAQGANQINLSRSNKLSEFTGTTKAWVTPEDDGSVWNPENIWAPELHHIDGKWYIYYTAGRPTSESGGSYTKQRSGVLECTAANPVTGAWVDKGMLYTGDNWTEGIVPTVENTSYAIDATVFKIGSQLYCIWSGYSSGDQRLCIATMSNPWTISSSMVQISKPDQSWELKTGKVNEGAAMITKNGKVFCVYSCNGSWTKEYALAYLQLKDGADPMVASNWTKSSGLVFTRCDNTTGESAATYGVNGVGHCSLTTSPDDTEDWVVYHTKNSNTSNWGTRSMFISKFTWNANGTPNFGIPPAWGAALYVPSGEALIRKNN